MAANTPFDTLKTARDLEAAGVDPRQAEAITTAMRNAVAEGVATKADIAGLETRLTKFGYALAFAVVAAQTALTVGLLRAFAGAG